jgi:hypothetical protein
MGKVPRPRRIVRRIAVVLAIVVAVPTLPLVWYVSAWMLFTRWATPVVRPADPYLNHFVTHPAFGPIERHIVAERPGTDLLLWLHEIADPN